MMKKVCLAVCLLLASVYCLADDYIGLRPVPGVNLPFTAFTHEQLYGCYMIYHTQNKGDIIDLKLNLVGRDPNKARFKLTGPGCSNHGYAPLCLKSDGKYDLLANEPYCYIPVNILFAPTVSGTSFRSLTNQFNFSGSYLGHLVKTNDEKTAVYCKDGTASTCQYIK